MRATHHPRQLSPIGRRSLAAVFATIVLLACLPSVVAFNEPGGGDGASWSASAEEQTEALADELAGHLLVSEVMTGGASASDEFIEIYNPGREALPLEGLEVIYVTASGATISRKAEWPAGAPQVAAGAHVLIANEAGIFAGIADVTYANGLAANGGSVAIRILGASSAIDAVGWGTAASAWMEGQPAAAATAGHSLERLPGGDQGSGQDSQQNSVDFVERATPDPQNSGSPPIPVPTPQPTQSATASASPIITPSATPSDPATPAPTATPTPTPSPTTMPLLTIADARALADGSTVTVEGVTITDSAFSDGGGYLVDASGGIAILLTDGSVARGQQVRVTGVVDDRFSQRTIRADASGVQVIGPGPEPAAQQVPTGAIGESFEGELVEVAGSVVSSPTSLTSGVALDLDDGSGVIRVLVADATGIDTSGWARGSSLQLRGAVGQRDSSGTGTTGYRVQPRDAADVIGFLPPATPSPTPSASGSPSPSGGPGVISIAAAREAPVNARVTVRGIVTLPSNLAVEGTAAIQDSSAAILLRLGDEVGSLALGELIEVYGTRSTMAGMETIRVVDPPRRLGDQPQPDAQRRATGAVGEDDEAALVIVRGAVTLSPRRTSAQNVYFDLDDGSGPVRVYVSPRSAARSDGVVIGSWVEVRGVLGQETTGRLPERGYRIWPRVLADLEIIATAPGTGGAGYEPGPGGGAAPTGAPVPGATAAASQGGHVEQQRLPQLAMATATASFKPGMAMVVQRDASSLEEPPVVAAAGLLALGGILLGGAGALVAPPGRLWQLLRALRDRLRARPDPEEPDPSVAAISDGMPALVPLTVLDGAAGARATHGPRSGGKRILPPT